MIHIAWVLNGISVAFSGLAVYFAVKTRKHWKRAEVARKRTEAALLRAVAARKRIEGVGR